jgi:endogenous inhibitor of DNA gyrase (YacG/DUF329 family)
VKEDEKYTCPICDWRVKIPRDAARPKLEDLQAWQDEIQTLPFQPEEEEILDKIIENAQNFRAHVAPYCNPIMATSEEAETQRFYLRKIEGAEILLAYETNFFRQELHKWAPVAPEPPPVLETSKSTRKPRPTKLQKLMAQHGVDDPEHLPQSLRTKPHSFSKHKSLEPTNPRPLNLQPAPSQRSDSATPSNYSMTGVPPYQPERGAYRPPGPYGYGDMHYTMGGPAPGTAAFAPHAYMHGGPLASPGFEADGTPQSYFTGAALGRGDPTLESNSLSPLRDSFAPRGEREVFGPRPDRDSYGRIDVPNGFAGAGHTHGHHAQRDSGVFDPVFNDFTNQEDNDGSQPLGERAEERRESHSREDGRGDVRDRGREGERDVRIKGEVRPEDGGQAGEFLTGLAMYEDPWASDGI